MTIDEFLACMDDTLPPVSDLEAELSCELPADYRSFLRACNGGCVGGSVRFDGPAPDGRPAEASVHHVGGLRSEEHQSIRATRAIYGPRIPAPLLWIMDDPCGNAICLAVSGPGKGQVFFWDHEDEPDPDTWDGRMETAGNLRLLAHSFTEFVRGLREPPRDRSSATSLERRDSRAGESRGRQAAAVVNASEAPGIRDESAPPAPVVQRRAFLVLAWSVWLVGPASFASAGALCLLRPELCSNPNVLLAYVLITTHVAAAGAMLVLVLDRAARRLWAVRMLCAYWVCVGGFMAPALLAMAGIASGLLRPLAPWCMRAALAIAVALPIVGAARLLHGRRQRRRIDRRRAGSIA